MKRWPILLGVLLVVTTIMAVTLLPQKQSGARSELIAVPAPQGDFERAEGIREFRFPEDFGPHDGFQTEWWYYTGNLTDEEGHDFGYQLTFFRRALQPLNEQIARQSDLAVEQVYLAHFTVTDVEADTFMYWERIARGSAGLAGATGDPYQVWLYDWQVQQQKDGSYALQGSQGNVSLRLELHAEKGPVLQGDRGYSRKGEQTGNASYYFSQTRLTANGVLEINGQTHEVQGTSWMDHEFSTSALSAGQVGWDWFSIQLDSGEELMVYTIRREDGSIDPFSNGTIIALDGSTIPLSKGDFQVEIVDQWTSPHSGANYPAGWVLGIPEQGLRIEIEPFIADQELQVSYTYWEGAVRVTGEWNGRPVSGRGYVELTGYAGSMAGQF